MGTVWGEKLQQRAYYVHGNVCYGRWVWGLYEERNCNSGHTMSMEMYVTGGGYGDCMRREIATAGILCPWKRMLREVGMGTVWGEKLQQRAYYVHGNVCYGRWVWGLYEERNCNSGHTMSMETYVTGGGYGDCMRREIATAGILCPWKRTLREVGMGTVWGEKLQQRAYYVHGNVCYGRWVWELYEERNCNSGHTMSMETYVTGGGYGDCMRREIATAGILCPWKRMLREVGMGTVWGEKLQQRAYYVHGNVCYGRWVWELYEERNCNSGHTMSMEMYVTGGGYGDCMRREIATAGILCPWKCTLREVGMGTVWGEKLQQRAYYVHGNVCYGRWVWGLYEERNCNSGHTMSMEMYVTGGGYGDCMRREIATAGILCPWKRMLREVGMGTVWGEKLQQRAYYVHGNVCYGRWVWGLYEERNCNSGHTMSMETYVTGGGYGDCMRREIATAGILCPWKRTLREVGMGTVWGEKLQQRAYYVHGNVCYGRWVWELYEERNCNSGHTMSMETYVTGGGYGDCMRREIATAGILCPWKRMLREVGMGTVWGEKLQQRAYYVHGNVCYGRWVWELYEERNCNSGHTMSMETYVTGGGYGNCMRREIATAGILCPWKRMLREVGMGTVWGEKLQQRAYYVHGNVCYGRWVWGLYEERNCNSGHTMYMEMYVTGGGYGDCMRREIATAGILCPWKRMLREVGMGTVWGEKLQQRAYYVHGNVCYGRWVWGLYEERNCNSGHTMYMETYVTGGGYGDCMRREIATAGILCPWKRMLREVGMGTVWGEKLQQRAYYVHGNVCYGRWVWGLYEERNCNSGHTMSMETYVTGGGYGDCMRREIATAGILCPWKLRYGRWVWGLCEETLLCVYAEEREHGHTIRSHGHTIRSARAHKNGRLE